MELSNEEQIYQLIREKVNDPYLSRYIISLKNDIERKETLEYHVDRWNKISAKYFSVKHSNYNKYSLIWDKTDYIVKVDHMLDFYNATGLSYQVVELLHVLIEKKDHKEWLKYDDKLYDILSRKIMIKMREL